ncbi:hypothetical protein Hanom_Chr09g00764741 [Helianthus anomalus]
MDLLFSLLNTQSWDFWSWCTWVAYYRILIPSLACFFWLWGWYSIHVLRLTKQHLRSKLQ